MQCVDAETLATWADGGLSKADAASVELHVSECDRCTAMLATFIRTTPEAPVVESLWHRWRLPWLVPIATAATAIALWVAIPRNQTNPNTTLDSAPTTASRATLPASPAPEGPLAPAASPASRAPSAAEGQFAREPSRQAAKESAPTTLSGALAKREAAPQPESRDDTANFRQEAREADEKAADLRADATGAARTVAAAPPSRPAPAVAPPAPLSGEALRERNTRTLAASQVVAQVLVISPDPATRWRVVGPGQVERSTDGGAQWMPATLPESATLTGGASPSPSVCWLVGRTGAIYVTSNGLRFTKVASPERTDFVSIQATDDRHATVITIDGRTFRTEDQGLTWVRVSP